MIKKITICFISIAIFLPFVSNSYSQDNLLDSLQIDLPENAHENEFCFSCHGVNIYKLYNSDSSEVISKHMCKIIDPLLYYDTNAVHRNFKCIDCHSEDFNTFPHPVEARFEPPYTCGDCHEGDEDYVKYNFEGIAEEFYNSVHYKDKGEEFNCWKCHNPHGYILHARKDSVIKTLVAYNNNFCLSCHTNIDRFELLGEHSISDIVANHQWLPNQEAHFQNVRCIDCHTKVSDTTLVAHEIQPKEKAVKKCVECHSRNSHLLASLYKFQTSEARSQAGFLNAVILNRSYVIGANRNIYLNRISLAILILTLGGILTHIVFRLITKK